MYISGISSVSNMSLIGIHSTVNHTFACFAIRDDLQYATAECKVNDTVAVVFDFGV